MSVISLTGVRQCKLTMRHARRNPGQSLSTACPGSLIHSAVVMEQRHVASQKTLSASMDADFGYKLLLSNYGQMSYLVFFFRLA